ncbi:hypothetical protein ABZ958_06325 [Streptomyces sp. NPDC046237]|uniref:hypothetical protein n=1 Tax=Streptomyces sp. NPDC046237 TaxID=3154914 RepID=UPI003408B0BB
MALVVSFLGTVPIPETSAGTAYRIWQYKIDGTGSEIPNGLRMALALPSNVQVVDPSLYPGVSSLDGSFLWREPVSGLHYVGRTASQPGTLTISFVATARTSTGEMLLFKSGSATGWTSVQFSTVSGGTPGTVQTMVLPTPGAPAYTGQPVYDFTGTLPYASELLGVYQPLVGWLGAHPALSAAALHPQSAFAGLNRESFRGGPAQTLSDEALAALAERYRTAASGGLSPVGLVNLFREYFFEFDTFLGIPAGHIWVSPGGTVEVVETSTRRTLVEKVAEVSEEITRKTEESLTEQDDVADAVKEENASDTKLGVSVTGGVNAKIYHADASLSFSTQNTAKRGSEATHKQTRTQTAKATSEIKRNFKTTFKTVTETTDTSSRRYVLQNNTTELVNYEMRRKMRKVGVQLQHVGTRLCWQVYLGDPGADLGLGDMVHVVEAPDLTAVPRPEKLPDLEDKLIPFHFDIPFLHNDGPDKEGELTYTPHPDNACRGLNSTLAGEDDTVQFCFTKPLPPPPEDYELTGIASVERHGARVEFAPFDSTDLVPNPDTSTTPHKLKLRLTYANWQGKPSLPFDAMLTYKPTAAAVAERKKINEDAEAAYRKQVERLQHVAYGKAVRERLRLVSAMRARPAEDLRSEERRWVFRNLIRKLQNSGHYPAPPAPGEPANLPYLEAEEIQRFFDVDEMLYFVAPDFWRPGPLDPPPVTRDSVGRYPVPPEEEAPSAAQPLPLAGQTVAGWYSRADEYKAAGQVPPASEYRVDYLITEQTEPAPLGSSLGWLIQIDADGRRNEFLNAAWVKAVMPVRPGQEVAALTWLKEVEGEAGLGLDYTHQSGDPDSFVGKKVGQVLTLVAQELKASNTDHQKTAASEKVFERGFDPLEGGFRPAELYEIFDQWVEVLPTDQVAAVPVSYDPKTGQQL